MRIAKLLILLGVAILTAGPAVVYAQDIMHEVVIFDRGATRGTLKFRAANGNTVTIQLKSGSELQVDGSILPAVDIGDALGSATRRWNELHVSTVQAHTLINTPVLTLTGGTQPWSLDMSTLHSRFTTSSASNVEFRLDNTGAGDLKLKVTGDIEASGEVDTYWLQTNKVDVRDPLTGFFWDIQAQANMAANSSLKIRDNSGNNVLEFWRAASGSAVDYASVYVDWNPDADLSQKLGASGRRWDKLYVKDIDMSGTFVGGFTLPSNVVLTDSAGPQLITSEKQFAYNALRLISATTDEGGQMQFDGGGTHATWYTDVYQDEFRIFTASSAAMGVTMANYSTGTMQLTVGGNILAAANLTVYGGSTVSGNSDVGGDLVVSGNITGGAAMYVPLTGTFGGSVYATNGQNTPHINHALFLSAASPASGYNLRFLPYAAEDSYNPLVDAGDAALVYTGGAAESGSFAIVPFSASNKGLKFLQNTLILSYMDLLPLQTSDQNNLGSGSSKWFDYYGSGTVHTSHVDATGNMTVGGQTTLGNFNILNGANPFMHWYETDGPFNAKWWRMFSEGGSIYLQTVDDGYLNADTVFVAARSGSTATTFTFGSNVSVGMVNLTVTGTCTGCTNTSGLVTLSGVETITGSKTFQGATLTVNNANLVLGTSAFVSGSILPVGSGVYSLGDSSHRFNNVFATNLDVSGTTSNLGTINDHLRPGTPTGTYDIGQASQRWRHGYFGGTVFGNSFSGNTLTLTGSATMGAITVTSCTGCGSTAPANMVTTDTNQIISGIKQFSNGIQPSGGGVNIGTSVNRWGTLYVGGLDANGTTFNLGNIADNVRTLTHGVYDIGQSSTRWRRGYFSDALISGSVSTGNGAFSGTVDASSYASGGVFGTTTTLTCPGGQAIKSISTRSGLVTTIICGAP